MDENNYYGTKQYTQDIRNITDIITKIKERMSVWIALEGELGPDHTAVKEARASLQNSQRLFELYIKRVHMYHTKNPTLKAKE